MAEESVAGIIRDLYEVVARLEAKFPGRPFTPDGHLVGSIGEAIAAERYGLELLPPSAEKHDAVAPDGRLVQIKATQRKQIGLYSCPDWLLVLKLHEDGSAIEVYNGPGATAWDAAGKMQKNGQRVVSVAKLHRLAAEVVENERLRTAG